jgi:hypothetical protein
VLRDVILQELESNSTDSIEETHSERGVHGDSSSRAFESPYDYSLNKPHPEKKVRGNNDLHNRKPTNMNAHSGYGANPTRKGNDVPKPPSKCRPPGFKRTWCISLFNSIIERLKWRVEKSRGLSPKDRSDFMVSLTDLEDRFHRRTKGTFDYDGMNYAKFNSCRTSILLYLDDALAGSFPIFPEFLGLKEWIEENYTFENVTKNLRKDEGELASCRVTLAANIAKFTCIYIRIFYKEIGKGVEWKCSRYLDSHKDNQRILRGLVKTFLICIGEVKLSTNYWVAFKMGSRVEMNPVDVPVLNTLLRFFFIIKNEDLDLILETVLEHRGVFSLSEPYSCNARAVKIECMFRIIESCLEKYMALVKIERVFGERADYIHSLCVSYTKEEANSVNCLRYLGSLLAF